MTSDNRRAVDRLALARGSRCGRIRSNFTKTQAEVHVITRLFAAFHPHSSSNLQADSVSPQLETVTDISWFLGLSAVSSLLHINAAFMNAFGLVFPH